MIIGGSASQKLAAKIAKELECPLIPIETKRFPDGERYVRIKGKVGEEVTVVQSTGYPQDENLIELFLILKNLKSMGVKKIKVVIPYFGYGRQERRFKSGEAVSAVIIANLLEAAGADEIFCINLHEDNIREFFQIPVHNLSAMKPIAEYIKNNLNDPVIVAPDKGALGFAKEIAEILGCEYDYLEKTRLSPEVVETKPKNLDVKGKEAVIIDDIISTGGTIVNATKILKEHGATKVVVSCVHPVLVEDALLKLFAADIDDVIATDTLRSDVSLISVAQIVADAVK
ncbi:MULTISPECIES: ribose-phosphate diphosphokinase [Methanobacterium]|jgi:ribose-phosphate pyrophosphokinase|uniref:Ribose-phosphate pyrophosphokinase n=1 Tax=Methanobacterium veterum TaxID=408577 RepID=A0A9E5DPU2_9EURY|nr:MULTISPECIES: ribose-phosphate diphosphokinase [Methanobacterium]MCZ3366796.1 ribose-phosphate diphosphokinase [Methanobacterium veterum]MCZ3374057.1 ribose-phosphate diphosphokinase [Methanobacterium veterum]